MEINEVISRIQSGLPDALVTVEGADCNFTCKVVSPAFAGQRLVLRQQQVLACFSEELADGRLHALTVLAFTPEEQRSASSLVQLSI